MARSRRHELKVFYFAVHDPTYPRNVRIRDFLQTCPDVARVDVHVKARSTSRVRTKITDLTALWHGSRGADVIVVSEFALPYALPAAVVARLRRSRLVVDGFVGAYETVIGDQRQHGPRSWQAVRHRLTDAAASWVADLFLIDTRVRAAEVRRRPRAAPVLSLPVGAPGWAQPAPLPTDGCVRLLFYGSFLPLHGVDVIIDAVASLRSTDVQLVLVGSGAARDEAGKRVAEAGLADRVTFLEAVPSSELADLIACSHGVFGVFGDSPKARTVIPNKVWQGLAAGRVVITRDSAALPEISGLVGDQLQIVSPSTATELASRLDDLLAGWAGTVPAYPVTVDVLAHYVAAEFAAFAEWLSAPRR